MKKQKSLLSGTVIAFSLCLLLASCRYASAQDLQASATLELTGQTLWDYTLTNSEPAGSTNWIDDFFLPINAPVTNIISPNGWQIDSDNQSYIVWSNMEPAPYPDDIAPGLSVSGFEFTSVATGYPVLYSLDSGDHSMDAPGPSVSNTILAPAVFTSPSVPEPAPLPLLCLGLATLALPVISARRRRTATQ